MVARMSKRNFRVYVYLLHVFIERCSRSIPREKWNIQKAPHEILLQIVLRYATSHIHISAEGKHWLMSSLYSNEI